MRNYGFWDSCVESYRLAVGGKRGHERVDDGVDGYITERSSVEDLVRVLRIVLADEKLQESIGREARRKMLRFTPEQVFPIWINYIDQ